VNRVTRTALRLGVHLMHLGSNLLGDDWVGRHCRVGLLRSCGARLGAGTVVHGGSYLTFPARLQTGRRCFVNRSCYLDLEGPIVLGDDVVIGHGSTLVTSSHEIGASRRRAGMVTGRRIDIEDGAWLGANVTVLAGVRIGRGAVIAAGAVVTRDVPPDVVAAGVPARVLRSLTGEPDLRLTFER